MMRNERTVRRRTSWVAAVLLLVFLGMTVAGCGEDSQTNQDGVVYRCRDTGQLVVGPRQPTPAVNPKTGRKTLLRALYCRQCEKWYPVPPATAAAGNPSRRECPRHQSRLVADGPIPEASLFMEGPPDE